jgi:hypothetical protein
MEIFGNTLIKKELNSVACSPQANYTEYGNVIYIVAEGWRDVPSSCIHGEWQELLPYLMNDSLALSCHWQVEN